MATFTSEITVGYWAIRGLAAPLRMMVMYSGTPLQAQNYNLTDKEGGGFDASAWFSVKPALKEKNPLMNLPYVIIGDDVICQSNACMLAVGRRLNLLGDSPADLIACEQLLCEIMDIRDKMIENSYIYPPEMDPARAKGLIDAVTGKNGSFQKLELWLARETSAGRSGNFLVADRATAPDFHLFEMLDQYSLFARFYDVKADLLDNFPHLQKFHTHFRELPQNAAYFGSVLYRLPLNNKAAVFGSTPSGAKWVPGSEDAFAQTSGLF